ncbi:MAG: hypothetical protein ACREOK_16350 [Gemmatimonadaceae bacterium]
MKLVLGVALITLITLIAACGRDADRDDTTAGGADTGAMAGMTGMGGMQGMGGMMSGAMMESMRAHMQSMDTASAASTQAMLPMHRQMAGNMIAQMNTEMRSMNMTGDARWNALMDSVRQDLVRMPEMSAEQLSAFMAEHHGRMMRLMQSHRDMMKDMKM